MPLLRITNGFDKLPDAKLLERASFIHQQVSTRTSVFPTPIPSMTDLLLAIDTFQARMNTALGGDRVAVAQKNVARGTVIDLLHQLGHYVLLTANGDRLIAQESGFTLAKEPTPVIMTKPTDLQVENSNQSGELLVSVKRVKGAASYSHQYTSDPTLKEESWMSINCTQAKCKLMGLTPGTIYFLRVAVVGPKDQVLYSDVVSKMAA